MGSRTRNEDALFAPLSRLDERIANAFEKIEANAKSDPELTCASGRKFLEYVLRYLDKHHGGIEPRPRESLFNLTNRLKDAGILPRLPARWAHSLRDLGNIAIHAGERGQEANFDDANEVLDVARKLAGWLVSTIAPEQGSSRSERSQPVAHSGCVEDAPAGAKRARGESLDAQAPRQPERARGIVDEVTPSKASESQPKRVSSDPVSTVSAPQASARPLRCLYYVNNVYANGTVRMLVLLCESDGIFSIPRLNRSSEDGMKEAARIRVQSDLQFGISPDFVRKCTDSYYIAKLPEVLDLGHLRVNNGRLRWLYIEDVRRIKLNSHDQIEFREGLLQIAKSIPPHERVSSLSEIYDGPNLMC